ncbi:hypothetical protein [Rhizobacter sp. Root404]|uniref:hypothetical protein n=1 Tax=Rhizobacter sp. Root404 TaxID=1736528 RepID=UPI000700A385|nr:hypothetical protein [Rhizobacter sp. Root404]KQW36761.1 hypothetical protein ASC76_19180 [Rhizobacter sp. Root404]
MTTINFLGDGVTRGFDLPGLVTTVASATVDGVVQPYFALTPSWDLLFETAPAQGANITVAYSDVDATASDEGSDGSSRVYQFKSITPASRLSLQKVNFTDVAAQNVALFDLVGAKTGDHITIYIETKPTATPHIAFVLPVEFAYGRISVINLATPVPADGGVPSTSQQFVMTADMVGTALVGAPSAPGIRTVASGTTELLLAPLALSNGSKLTSLNLFSRSGYFTTVTEAKDFPSADIGTQVTFYVPGHHGRALYLEDIIANSVQMYADQRISVSLEVSARTGTLGWGTRGTVSWSTNANGSVDTTTITGTTSLTRTAGTNGFFRQLVPGAINVPNSFLSAVRLRLTITGYPGTPATSVAAAVAYKDAVLFT